MSKSQTSCNLVPLDGIKVVDLGRYGAGPACAMILADMGAETIKVEEPGKGDPARTDPPLVGDISGYFPYYNRNKKGVTLNLRAEKGRRSSAASSSGEICWWRTTGLASCSGWGLITHPCGKSTPV